MAETTSSVALLNRMRNELVTRQSTLREDGPVDEEVNDAFLVIDAKLDELEAIDRVIQEMEFQFQPTDQDPSQNN